mgnify:CR=1 FL=1|jgi:hypothetical protein
MGNIKLIMLRLILGHLEQEIILFLLIVMLIYKVVVLMYYQEILDIL